MHRLIQLHIGVDYRSFQDPETGDVILQYSDDYFDKDIHAVRLTVGNAIIGKIAKVIGDELAQKKIIACILDVPLEEVDEALAKDSLEEHEVEIAVRDRIIMKRLYTAFLFNQGSADLEIADKQNHFIEIGEKEISDQV